MKSNQSYLIIIQGLVRAKFTTLFNLKTEIKIAKITK